MPRWLALLFAVLVVLLIIVVCVHYFTVGVK